MSQKNNAVAEHLTNTNCANSHLENVLEAQGLDPNPEMQIQQVMPREWCFGSNLRWSTGHTRNLCYTVIPNDMGKCSLCGVKEITYAWHMHDRVCDTHQCRHMNCL